MEEEKSLKTGAHIRQLPNPVKDKVHNLLSDGIVTSSIVVGSILLTIDQLLRMEELAVGSASRLINYSRFQIDKDSSRDMFTSSSLREEGGEGIVSESFVRRHVAIRLDSMLKTVKLPTGITNLDTCLSNVDGDTFTLKRNKLVKTLLEY